MGNESHLVPVELGCFCGFSLRGSDPPQVVGTRFLTSTVMIERPLEGEESRQIACPICNRGITVKVKSWKEVRALNEANMRSALLGYFGMLPLTVLMVAAGFIHSVLLGVVLVAAVIIGWFVAFPWYKSYLKGELDREDVAPVTIEMEEDPDVFVEREKERLDTVSRELTLRMRSEALVRKAQVDPWQMMVEHTVRKSDLGREHKISTPKTGYPINHSTVQGSDGLLRRSASDLEALSKAESHNNPVDIICEVCGRTCKALGRPVPPGTVMVMTPDVALISSRYCEKCNIVVCGGCAVTSEHSMGMRTSGRPCPRCGGETTYAATENLRSTHTRLLR